MDGFSCSRCLNNRIKVPDMMWSFSGGATTPLVVKNLTKQPWLKIENLRYFDRDFALSRGKIWLCIFYTFLSLWFHDSTQKISSHFEQKWRRDGDFCDFCVFDRDFMLSRGRIWLWLFYNFFLHYGSMILHKKCQVILSKNEGMTEIFAIFYFFLIFFQSLKFKVWTL